MFDLRRERISQEERNDDWRVMSVDFLSVLSCRYGLFTSTIAIRHSPIGHPPELVLPGGGAGLCMPRADQNLAADPQDDRTAMIIGMIHRDCEAALPIHRATTVGAWFGAEVLAWVEPADGLRFGEGNAFLHRHQRFPDHVTANLEVVHQRQATHIDLPESHYCGASVIA